MSRLVPLAQQGYLRLVNPAQQRISSDTLVESPPAAAILWLRSWFQPVHAKPLFSREDVGALLEVSAPEVLALAASYGIPVTFDEALGWLLSTFAARQLVLKVLSARAGTGMQRMDRQALLWFLLEDDPKRALAPPTYNEATERALAAAAEMNEPARSVRTQELLDAMHDAERLAAGVKERRKRRASVSASAPNESGPSASQPSSETS